MIAVLLGIAVLAVAWWIIRRLVLLALAAAAIIVLLALAHHRLPTGPLSRSARTELRTLTRGAQRDLRGLQSSLQHHRAHATRTS